MFWEEKSTWFLKSRDSPPGESRVGSSVQSLRPSRSSEPGDQSLLHWTQLRDETPAAAVSAPSGPAPLLLLLLLLPYPV